MEEGTSSAIVEQLRSRKSETEGTEEKQAFITFQILDEMYALSIENVRYSLKVEKITPVPDVPSFVLGITNVLGEIISVVDISDFIFQKPVPLNEKKRFLLLIQWEDIETSFLVTDLLDMVFWAKSEIRKDILPLSKEKRDYFLGGAVWNGKIIGVLNLKKILRSERMDFGEKNKFGDVS